MRQYGMVPPILSTAQPPAVSAATGLGTGGGAGVQSKGSPSDGQGFGHVDIQVGPNPATGGSIVLQFPTTPPTMVYLPDTVFAGFAVAGQGTQTHTLTWTNALLPNQRRRIDYEWSVSQ